jgi:fumarate reductase subunit D
VWVHFLGRRLVVAHGGVPATVAPVLLLLVGVLIPAGALINAVRTPRSAFTAIGRSKVRWIVSMLVLFLIGDASFLIVPLYYLLRVRPQLRRQRADAFV